MADLDSNRIVHQKRQRRLDLKFARRWLGLRRAMRGVVFIAAADALGERHPLEATDGYVLLRRFHKAFRHAQKPHVPIHATKTRIKAAKSHKKASDEFLLSYDWRKLRMTVLKARGARCECCGATPKDGIVIHVDHIKPRRKYPELALTASNLQVLCEVCNHGKGNWDETDWRAVSQTSGESSMDSPVTRSGDGDGHQRPVTTFPRLIRKKCGNASGQEDKAKQTA